MFVFYSIQFCFIGLLVLTALNFLTTLFYYIPKASLAGLIITAMIFMVEYHTIGVIWNTKSKFQIIIIQITSGKFQLHTWVIIYKCLYKITS